MPSIALIVPLTIPPLLSSALVGREPYLVRQGTRPGCRNTSLEVWWSAGGLYMGLVALSYGPLGHFFCEDLSFMGL